MAKVISHNNILYVADISKIGGVETFVYEMAKKYCHLDIAVCCKSFDVEQVERIRKYCPVYLIEKGDTIECKICVINYDASILDHITSGDVYMVFHADYSANCYKVFPKFDERIKRIYFNYETHSTSYGRKIPELSQRYIITR